MESAEPQLWQTMGSATQTAAGFVAIAAVYLLVIRYRAGVSWREALGRAGLRIGELRYYGYGALSLVGLAPAIYLMHRVVEEAGGNSSSPYLAFETSGFTPMAALAAVTYGIVSAGFGEELVFRGLIGGALDRRMRRRRANLTQALVFLAPHLLILILVPTVWWLLVPGVFGMALICGWLRLGSGSIGPAVLVHGGGNTGLALLIAAGAM